jgi:hypothetical protein
MNLAELAGENILWLCDRTAMDVAERFSSSSCSIIGIDGFMHSGKSPLSCMLEFQLGVECLHIDDYLPPARPEHNGLRFVDVLDLQQLRRSVDVRRARGPLLIEGILLRDIIELLSLKDAVFHVYVAAVWRPSASCVRWNEGDRLVPGAFNSPLDTQIVEYHTRQMPQNCFDVAVLRDQDQSKSTE